MTWADRPLLCLDFETTGTDPRTARPVSVAAAFVDLDGTVNGLSTLVDAGVDIPPETTAVHGITREQVMAEGRDAASACRDVIDAVRQAVWQEQGIVIFNARYDWTLLMAEAARHGWCVPTGACIVDPTVIDKHVDRYRKGRRTLTATAAHYDVTLLDAHSALADAVASAGVARKLATVFPEVGTVTLADLHAKQAAWYETWRVGFNEYLIRRDPDAKLVEPGWPLAEAKDDDG